MCVLFELPWLPQLHLAAILARLEAGHQLGTAMAQPSSTLVSRL